MLSTTTSWPIWVAFLLKMQVAFAAWLGCALPFAKALLSTLTIVALILLMLLVVRFVKRYTDRTTNEETARSADLRYGWTASLNVATICALDWMRLL